MIDVLNDHTLRAHALISPSSLYRDLVCTAAPLLTKDMPDTSSPYALEGTLAHELCELLVRCNMLGLFDVEEPIAKVRKQAEENGFDFNEMFRHANAYAEYVGDRFNSFDEDPFLAVETRLDLTEIIPDGFGTADCILIGNKRLIVVDFKYGQSPNGRVSATGNPQMIAYAIGAYYEFRNLYDIRTVEMHIFQPRVSDGISDYSMSVEELLKDAEAIKTKVAEALSGNGVFAPSAKTCKYCKAKDRCKARAEANLALEGMSMTLRPELMRPEEIAEAIRAGEDLAAWLEEVKARALSESLQGVTIPGFKAVEGRGGRDWTDMQSAFQTLMDAGIAESLLYERKPITLAAAEKLVGKKRFGELVGDLVEKTPGKPALVPESDKRPAITMKVKAADVFGAKGD